MKKIFLFLLVFAVRGSFAQDDLSWYKMLKGKVGTYPVTMHLHKAGHEFKGYYYYDNYQLLMAFTGDDTSTKEKITLNVQGERFVFSLNSGIANGNWKKPEGKTLEFSAREVTSPVGFTYVYSSGSAKLRPHLKVSPEANISQASVWPTGNSATANFVKNIIREHFEATNSKEDIGSILLAFRKKKIAEYLNDNKELSDEEASQAPYAYGIEIINDLMVGYQTPKILSLAGYGYWYTGGAHGNHGTIYMAINLATNKKFTVSDVITKEGMNALSSLLEKNFRRQYDVKPTEKLSEAGLFEDKINPNNNFFLTGKGIGFAYNPYEIAPYVMGEIEIYIPFSDLKKYLKPDFKALAGII